MTISAGKMRERLSVMRESDKPQYDGRGVLISQPVEIARVWAEIRPLQGNEPQLAQQLSATVDHVVVLRYTPTTAKIAPPWWLEGNGRRWEISSLRNVRERDARLELFCTEVSQ